jgi:uncharacterized membrane protein YgaE (UPF0421/DUF939 family)
VPTSDDQLKKKQDSVDDHRKDLAAREAEVLRLQREKENDVTADRLETETNALKAQIAAKNEEIKVLGGDPEKVTVKKTRAATGADEALAAATTPSAPSTASTPKGDDTKKEG